MYQGTRFDIGDAEIADGGKDAFFQRAPDIGGVFGDAALFYLQPAFSDDLEGVGFDFKCLLVLRKQEFIRINIFC